jgi:SpoVK/Ycf46/Vps4 family AAA+-type ATPase
LTIILLPGSIVAKNAAIFFPTQPSATIIMTKGNAIAALQKTYDDCHLVCSTAIYFEGRNDETEALRCWKNALDQISYHNLYRLPSNYQPKSETEKALYQSLRQLELQCKERIDLLEALKKSRKEAGVTAEGDVPPAMPGTTVEGWLGSGTIPPMSYPDLAKPPSLPSRPLPPRTVSAESTRVKRSMYRPSGSTNNERPSRTPSPEKQMKMRSTLRGERTKKTSSSLVSSAPRPPAAAKAATQAWTSKKEIYPLGSSNLSPDYSRDAANWVTRLSLGNAKGRSKSPTNGPSPFDDFDGAYIDEAPRATPRPSPNALRLPKSRGSDDDLVGLSSPSDSELSRVQSRQPGGTHGDRSSRPFSPKDTSPRTSPYATSRRQKSHINTVSTPAVPSDGPYSNGGAAAVRRKPLRTPPIEPSYRTSSEGSDEEEEDEEEEDEIITPAESWKLFTEGVLKNLPRGVDSNAADQILNEIIIQGDEVHWDDIAGLDIAKAALKENVVYPFLRPDLFLGLREPARGMLLFGPPGTGKTMLARAVATESKSTFFAISASSLTSKFLGESEKLVRALFALAKMLAPSIIFVDEIDSLLSSRNETGEHEASRRIKTEFLIQWSDLARAAAGREQGARDKIRGDPSRVLVLAATNAPWAIDDAARRRFVRRQYIPLPEKQVRAQHIRTLLAHQKQDLTVEEVENLVDLTEGWFILCL